MTVHAKETKVETPLETAVSYGRLASDFLKRQKPFFWVLVAWFVCFFYFSVLASNRYASETRIYVKSIGAEAPVLPTLGGISLGASSGVQDIALLRDYLHSRDLLTVLDERLGLKAHYSDKRWDFISRLSADAPEEEFLEYFRDHVQLFVDTQSGIMSVNAQGFTPDFALQLTQEMLKEGEDFINRVGQNVAAQQVLFVEGELDRAKAALEDAAHNLLAFQIANRTLSPEAEGQSVQGIILSLKGDIVRLHAEEKVLLSYLNEKAPEVVALRARIDALDKQLNVEQSKVSGQMNGDEPIGEMQIDFNRLELQREFAYDLYKSAFASLEKARVDAYRKLKHLVVVQSPIRPEKEQYPRRAYDLLTIFVILTLGYGILALVVATIKEHRDV